MGKNLRSSAATNGNKVAGHFAERLNSLEKRYSKVMVHETYFKILDEWMQCMFGAQLFPKPSEMENLEDEELDDESANPFYELHMLQQRVNYLEDTLENMGVKIPSFVNRNQPQQRGGYKVPVKKAYVPAPPQRTTTTAIKRKAPGNNARPVTVLAVKSKPPVLKPAASPQVSPTKVSKDPSSDADKKPQVTNEEKTGEGVNESKNTTLDETSIKSEDDAEKPPVLEQQQSGENNVGGNAAGGSISSQEGAASSMGNDNDEEMDVDDEDYLLDEEEDEDMKPDLDELNSIEYVPPRARAARASSKKANNSEIIEEEQPEPVITYTTRGRRHTLPRRYAEFTGHDNVASILKSQQRAAANQGLKAKRPPQEQKPKTPSKPKAPPAPKSSTPKKMADGTRPECVYKLIADVQAKEVDDNGDITLWDAYPEVRVNQQQLISVVFRSNGMATRLTRKLTTLVFEDQVLANTSPFGTKYYQERLPPEPLSAMVEFIENSGFDADYTKKKIYMVVGQVCNEARAGRVRKLAPLGSQPGEESLALPPPPPLPAQAQEQQPAKEEPEEPSASPSS